jgi:predicted  nucleic acid-binding Zn-ribbon protein
MPGIVETLRELHRLHRLIRDVKAETEKGPRLLRQQQMRLTRAEDAVREGHDTVKKLKVTSHETEVSLKAAHQQIAKYEKQRETAASKKEMDAFEHEITHNKQQCAKLEDEVFAVLTEIDDRTAKTPELDKTLATAKRELAGFEQEENQRQVRLAGELQRAEAELTELEKILPSDIRSIYDRLITAHGADGIAAVKDKTCSNCNGSLTQQHLRELDAGRFFMCKNCGRALYI